MQSINSMLKKRNPLHSRRLGRFRLKRAPTSFPPLEEKDETHTDDDSGSEDNGDHTADDAINEEEIALAVSENDAARAAEERANRALLELYEREVTAAQASEPPISYGYAINDNNVTEEEMKAKREAGAVTLQGHARRRLAFKEASRLREEASLRLLEAKEEAIAREKKAEEASERVSKLCKLTRTCSERESQVQSTLTQIRNSERTDLCFMVDATGSMASQIEAVKAQIKRIAQDVQRTNPSLKLRVAIVGYRDALEGKREDQGGINSPFNFTDDLDVFVSNVSQIRAFGGKDQAEDVASGFRDVLSFNWASPTRVLFIIADAPSHGSRYHDSANDNHKLGDHGIPNYLKQLKQMNMDVVFCSINDSTDKMIRVMNSDVGSNSNQGPFITSLSMSSPSMLTAHATKTLRQSMQKTLTGGRSNGKSTAGRKAFGIARHLVGRGLLGKSEGEARGIRRFTLTPAEPAWGRLPELKALLYSDDKVDICSLRPGGSRKAVPATSRKLLCDTHAVKVAPEPFATGNVRFARWGRIMRSAGGEGGEESWQRCIFKDFKTTDQRLHALEQYLIEMEVNAVASALAEEFNKVASPPPSRQMRYVGASVASVEDGKHEKHFFVEEVLDGDFTRYSYNSGYWEEEKLDEWLLKFALWTHAVTGGYLMVTDLQGIATQDGYVLTDPVVLCTDLSRFGVTNMGEAMMERCKASAERHLEALVGTASLGGMIGNDLGSGGAATIVEEEETEEW